MFTVFASIFVVLIILVIVGYMGIQRTNNYENAWGMMFWYGLATMALLLGVIAAYILFHAIFI